MAIQHVAAADRMLGRGLLALGAALLALLAVLAVVPQAAATGPSASLTMTPVHPHHGHPR